MGQAAVGVMRVMIMEQDACDDNSLYIYIYTSMYILYIIYTYSPIYILYTYIYHTHVYTYIHYVSNYETMCILTLCTVYIYINYINDTVWGAAGTSAGNQRGSNSSSINCNHRRCSVPCAITPHTSL